MVVAEQVWVRYLPGLVAAVGCAAIVVRAPRPRLVTVTLLATLFGLVCMEAEYWVAGGFPTSEIPFFVGVVAISLAALAIGPIGTLALGVTGLLFFAYVNIRYGAPYLMDYVMPVLYTLLITFSRRALKWFRPGVLNLGWPEMIIAVVLQLLAVWRTTDLNKWGWITGAHWR